MRRHAPRQISQLYGGVVSQRRVSRPGLPSDYSGTKRLDGRFFYTRRFSDRKTQLEGIGGRRPPLPSPHHRPGGDQLAESLLVSERIPGPTQRPLAAAGRRVPEDKIGGLRLGLGHDPLFQADAVGERRTRHGPVEPRRGDRYEEDGDSEHDGEPERGGGHDVDGRAEVRVVEQLRVEREREAEVEENAAPDDEVVEPGPVRRVQGTLRTSDKCSVSTAIIRTNYGRPM